MVCFKYIIGDSGRTTFLVFLILGTFFFQHTCFPDSFIQFNSIIHIRLELLHNFQNVIDHEYSLLVFYSSFFRATRRKKKNQCFLSVKKSIINDLSYKAATDSVSTQVTVLQFHLVGRNYI